MISKHSNVFWNHEALFQSICFLVDMNFGGYGHRLESYIYFCLRKEGRMKSGSHIYFFLSVIVGSIHSQSKKTLSVLYLSPSWPDWEWENTGHVPPIKFRFPNEIKSFMEILPDEKDAIKSNTKKCETQEYYKLLPYMRGPLINSWNNKFLLQHNMHLKIDLAGRSELNFHVTHSRISRKTWCGHDYHLSIIITYTNDLYFNIMFIDFNLVNFHI